jgi:hypothetical protein
MRSAASKVSASEEPFSPLPHHRIVHRDIPEFGQRSKTPQSYDQSMIIRWAEQLFLRATLSSSNDSTEHLVRPIKD